MMFVHRQHKVTLYLRLSSLCFAKDKSEMGGVRRLPNAEFKFGAEISHCPPGPGLRKLMLPKLHRLATNNLSMQPRKHKNPP